MEAITVTPNINEDALRAAIEAVDENNDINDGKWSNWEGAFDIEGVYGIELCDEGRAIIERAIESNGASLVVDLPAVERAVWGQNFSGASNWCNRGE